MTHEEEQKQMGEILIGLATRIAKLEKKLIDITLWADTRQADSVKKLREILERK
jgi:hypothetical protein